MYSLLMKSEIKMTAFLIIIVYSLFAFLMTFSREIIKDLEDAEGDKIYGANTIALSHGIHKSKRIMCSHFYDL